MAQQITLTNKFKKIYFTMTPQYQPGMLLLEWEGFISEKEEALKRMNLAVEYAQKHQCSIVLNDNIKGQGPWPVKQAEIKEWVLDLKSAGVTKLAHVLAKQFFSALSANSLTEGDDLLDIPYFETRQEAEAWLKS